MAERRGRKEYSGYRRKERHTLKRVIFGILGGLFVLLILLFALSSFFCSMVKMESGAMSPEISISDTVGVNHLAYLLLRPRRGDIVQFSTSRPEQNASSESQGAPIRRIVALPGETIQISDGTVYINGHPLEEDYRSGEMTYGGYASSQLTLGSDEYFLMADNRSNHFDSRDSTVGPVSEADIIGKVWVRLQPYARFGLIG